MKKSPLALVLLIGLGAGCCCTSANKQQAKALFNGRDLGGWVVRFISVTLRSVVCPKFVSTENWGIPARIATPTPTFDGPLSVPLSKASEQERGRLVPEKTPCY